MERSRRPRGTLLAEDRSSICWKLADVTDVFLPSESLMACLRLLLAHDSNTIYTSPIWHRLKSFFTPLLLVGFLVKNQQSSCHSSLLSCTRFLEAEESSDWESRFQNGPTVGDWVHQHGALATEQALLAVQRYQAVYVLHRLVSNAASMFFSKSCKSRDFWEHSQDSLLSFLALRSASSNVDCWRHRAKAAR